MSLVGQLTYGAGQLDLAGVAQRDPKLAWAQVLAAPQEQGL